MVHSIVVGGGRAATGEERIDKEEGEGMAERWSDVG